MKSIRFKSMFFVLSIALLVFNSCILCSMRDENEYLRKKIDKYTYQIKQKPNSSWYYESRAGIYFKLKDYNKAIEDYKKALSIDKSHGTYYYLAETYLAKKMIDNSFAMINEAIKMKPDSIICYGLRGVCNDLLSKPINAISDYSKYLQRDYMPMDKNGYFMVYIRRSILYQQNKEYEKALADIDSAQKIDNSYADGYFLRFVIDSKLGKHEQALQELEKSFKKGFNDEQSIKEFIEIDDYPNKEKVNKLIQNYISKDERRKEFIFNKKEFIINKFLNLEKI